MQKYIYDPYTVKEITYSQKVRCAYRNCNCDAINSHLLQKNRWLKSIAEDGKVLQITDSHMQSLIDGDENGNSYSLHTIRNAMSLPIFCKQHDQKLFKSFEEHELDLNNEMHLLKLSYRAFCATIAQEKRNHIFYDINPQINTFCVGELFDEQRRYSEYVIDVFDSYLDDLYQHVKKKNTSDYMFNVVRTNRLPVCLSDVYINEHILYNAYEQQELKPKLFPIFLCMLYHMKMKVYLYMVTINVNAMIKLFPLLID